MLKITKWRVQKMLSMDEWHELKLAFRNKILLNLRSTIVGIKQDKSQL